MSPEEMQEMSYGEVLTSETINYRTGVPQISGLFCQAIFGPVKDWECQCGKYKRYRYAGVICDKCGVEVAHSAVRRERAGHINLAAACVHPWMLRVIPSRIALLLDIKSVDLSRICYFSSYVITSINEDMRQDYLSRIDGESEARVKLTRANFDKKFEDLGKQYQIDRSSNKFDIEHLKSKYEADKEIIKTQQQELITKIETVAEMARKELISLQVKDVITENIHQELALKFGPVFKAEIGAEAVETLLKNLDLDAEFETVKAKITASRSQAKKKLSKKLRLIKHFLSNNTDPAWMVLKSIMVLPPELRPMLQLDGGRFAASDLNDLYRRLINRNNRLRKLIQIGAPDVILRNEKRMLQEAVEALIDNTARNGKQVMASTGVKRALKSLTDSLKGKGGRFRQNLLGKRVDYSGRSVIIIGPNLALDECGLPKEMALELFKPFLIGRIIAKSEKGLLNEDQQAFNIHSARRLIESKIPLIYDILDEIIKDKYVLLNRAPTLHRLGFLAFKPILIEGKAIQIHPMVCRGFNADFDGDQMAVHVPITIKGQQEARDLMVATKNLLTPANGKLIMAGTEDIQLGVYYLSNPATKEPTPKQAFGNINAAKSAYQNNLIEIDEWIKVRFDGEFNQKGVIDTTVGRIILNQCLPNAFDYLNFTIDKSIYDKVLVKIFHQFGNDQLAKVLDKVKDTMFEFVTTSGISFSSGDLTIPSEKHALISETQARVTQIQKLYELGFLNDDGRHREIINQWRKTSEEVAEIAKQKLDRSNSLGTIITSGARGNLNQVNFMAGMRGLTVASNGEYIELPAVHSYIEGLTPLEYFVSMKGHRRGLAGTALQTADAGYLTRRLVDVAQNLVIMADDCGTSEGVIMTKIESESLKKSLFDRINGRYLAANVVQKDVVLASKDALITSDIIEILKAQEVEEITVRSVAKCLLGRGVCRKCYGIDFSSHLPVALGTAVGVIGAQSLGEPATQLAVGSVKHGVAIGAKSDITVGLPRVEEVLEARVPKHVAQVAEFDGVIEKIEGTLDQGFKINIKPNATALPSSSNEAKMTLASDVKVGDRVDVGDIYAISSDGRALISFVEGEITMDVHGNIILAQNNEVSKEYQSTPNNYILVKTGQSVKQGQPLTEGSLDLQMVAEMSGLNGTMKYIIKELNNIYVGNGIDVDEKHIELIVRQMTSRVSIIDSGDTEYVVGDIVRLSAVKTTNTDLVAQDKKPCIYKLVVVGISRASLATDSFLSAASFQETARVLVEATLSSRKDMLVGLKENVILGQLIPCGTGFDQAKIQNALELNEEFDEIEAVAVEE